MIWRRAIVYINVTYITNCSSKYFLIDIDADDHVTLELRGVARHYLRGFFLIAQTPGTDFRSQ